MKVFRQIIILIAALWGLMAGGCISDDFTTSPSDVLSFSTDTLSFDTVFTGVGTPTARLKVYNRAKKSINISRIRFKNPQTPFQINVDGVSGSSFSDVEIRGRDSIFLFVECYLPETSNIQPELTEDMLQFTTNGVEQEVLVEAWGQNVVRLKNLSVTQDMTLTADMPYVVFDSLTVEKNAVLRINPGAKVLFHDKASMRVRGRLEAVGAVDRMIDLRGDRIDNVLPDVGYDILAGQWRGITIEADSYNNRMEYVNMRSTEYGLRVDSCGDLSRQKLTLVNSWLHNSQKTSIDSKYAKVDAYGCVFSEAAESVVRLTGGLHEFVQCTLANYYLFSVISEPLLSLYHCTSEQAEDNPFNTNPLMKADFENCIIYGLASDINTGNLDNTDVYLKNVLLKSEGTNDDHFIDCIWGEDPLFYTVRSDYYFNYRLMEDSPAIGAGNPAFVSPICSRDMDGLLRLQDGPPALGAYVYQPPK